jgi:hypothetical protein
MGRGFVASKQLNDGRRRLIDALYRKIDIAGRWDKVVLWQREKSS